MSDPPFAPADHYRVRRDRFAAAGDAFAGKARHLSHARIVAFVLAVALGVWAEAKPAPLSVSLVALTLLIFVVLIAVHGRARRREAWFRELVTLNEQGLRRLERDWGALPVRRPTRDLARHPYAHDLDLYGRASISQLLGPLSGVGAGVLDDWLLARTAPSTVRARQEAVRELAPMHDLREELAIHGRRAASARTEDVARFLRWAEEGDEPGRGQAVLWAARVIPLLTPVLALLQLTGRIDSPLWLLPPIAAMLLTLAAGGRARATFRRVTPGELLVEHYPGLFAVAERASFRAPLLGAIQQRIAADGRPASQELARLAQLLHLADLRHSAMLHLPVQLLTLWDFHVQDGLERWRRRSGPAIRDWLDAAGELEALASLAVLPHDHPDWAFAEFSGEASAVLQGTAMGHPLLAETRRVDNDVRIGPPGTFLLVTGSNMSGKSTLLRAVGTNAVLAQAGAPCCARSFTLPPLDIWSCIRVEDSLAEGVSYFMAELRRLKQIVDAASRSNAEGGAAVLFLIDEVLNGTNTAERQIAARRVIRHLVEAGAIGIVTTHDLDLARGPELSDRAELAHFRETLHHQGEGSLEMTFDYRLRPGLATSTNALALLEYVGLSGA
jgi:hypothetical protein